MRIHQVEPGASKSSRVNYVLEEATAKWPRLVDDATWWAVHRILTDPARVKTKPHRPGGRLLSAVAYCGACGAPLTVNQSGRGVWRYVCRVRSCASVPVKDLEDYVTAVMIRWLSDPQTAADLASEGDVEAVELAVADIGRAEAELRDLHKQAEHGDITPALAGSFEKGINARIADAKQRMADAETKPILKGRIGPGAENGWKAMTVPQRRQLIATVARISIHTVGKRPGPRVGSRPAQVPVDARVEWQWLTGSGAGQDAAVVAEKIAAYHAAETGVLTERLARVAHLLAEGWSRREMAAELGLSMSRLDHLIAETKKAGIAQPPAEMA
jgi:hypothetical protein